MAAGRPPQHEFNTLEIGQKCLLKGKAYKYPHQFINQFNIKGKGKLKVVREDKKIFAERIS
jgi:hypothetical protein